MKRIFFILCLAIASILSYSCNGETCTSGYMGALKIDEKKADKVFIKYIGPKKRNYEQEFNFSSNNTLPYGRFFYSSTICSTEDFKNNNYDFLEIKNLDTENSIYVCAVTEGAEIDNAEYYYRYVDLLKIYDNQDKDPNYDYKKDKYFERVNYVDRYEFYEQLIKDKYPYIIKLAPQQTCIMKWGGLGFKVL